MRARIHRGADEVGGSCVELESECGDRLVLDLGLPLTAEPREGPEMPAVIGLDGRDPLPRGILVSHGHPDHYGLLSSVSPEVPIYMGKAASRILREASFFTPLGLDREPSGIYLDREPITLGAFTVTPNLVDHSAFDSYAFLIDADGSRLFYTADLRGHGRKDALFERLISAPPIEVDSLLLEGTTVGRARECSLMTERDVEDHCLELIRDCPGMALACYSPQNIDRLVSVYKAAVRSNRELVIDLYGAAVAEAAGQASIPKAGWEKVRVFVPQSQRVRVKRSGEFRRVDALGSSRIFPVELAERPDRWVLCFRPTMGSELASAGCLDGARALWMMWPGYLDGESGMKTRAAFERLGLTPQVIHASGHASVADLQRLARAVDPERVVPIHTDAPQRYPKLFERVSIRPNGEWWDV